MLYPLISLSNELLEVSELLRDLVHLTRLSTCITLEGVRSIGDCLSTAFGKGFGSMCDNFGVSLEGRGTLLGNNFNGVGAGLRGILNG